MQVVREFPLLLSPRKLCEFLGLVSFYHRFFPHAADLLYHLNQLLEVPKDGNKAVAWTELAKLAFQAAKATRDVPTSRCTASNHD